MIALAVLLGGFAGFTALSFAMDKHHRDMTGVLPKGRNLLIYRYSGGALLMLTGLFATVHFGVGIGMAFWIGTLMLSALCVATGLTYRPRLLPKAGLFALPLSLCAAALAGLS